MDALRRRTSAHMEFKIPHDEGVCFLLDGLHDDEARGIHLFEHVPEYFRDGYLPMHFIKGIFEVGVRVIQIFDDRDTLERNVLEEMHYIFQVSLMRHNPVPLWISQK